MVNKHYKKILKVFGNLVFIPGLMIRVGFTRIPIQTSEKKPDPDPNGKKKQIQFRLSKNFPDRT